MCGIVGYAGREQAAPILLHGLSRLEYRGYDSAGICVFDGEKLNVMKTRGRLQALRSLTRDGTALTGLTGLGHTRWATHGAPSAENSHPHFASNHQICIVHNGIIENYLPLKEFLLERGKTFRSETDTEVAANLIEYYYEECGDLRKGIRLAEEKMSGSYAMGIFCARCPGRIVAIKKESPLIFGFGDCANFIASDAAAILSYTREVVYLNDGDMVDFTCDSAAFYNAGGEQVQRKPEHITWEVSAAEKNGYDHFMLKEIYEQPRALRDTLSARIRDGQILLEDMGLEKDFLKTLSRIYIVACGSAYYVGCAGKYFLEQTCRIPAEAVMASEFRYGTPVLDERTLVIIISQSGETADTLAALREAKEQGARTLAIVNVVGSAIAKEAHHVLYTLAGPEIAVATTKAYSTQLAVLAMLAAYMGNCLGKLAPEEYREMVEALKTLPDQVSRVLAPESVAIIRHMAEIYSNRHDVFFIGRNTDSATALEGSLKLKEIAYLHSEAYPAGELKHGPISLIEDGTLVVALATVGRLHDKMLSNVKEVKARGATVLGIVPESAREEVTKVLTHYITVPEVHPLVQPNVNVVPLQLLSYYIARNRGCDVDKPRNLAKSVTVE